MKIDFVNYNFNPIIIKQYNEIKKDIPKTEQISDNKVDSSKKVIQKFEKDKKLNIVIWKFLKNKKVVKQIPIEERIKFAHYLIDYLNNDLNKIDMDS